jgi:imidazole glycerol-phosphate synthase subunit HisH
MSSTEVTIIDYGVGNLLSVKRGLEKSGANVVITSDTKTILSSQRIVLPGVGAFQNAMKSLNNLGLVEAIHEASYQNIPILGICLGMQLLLDESEEFGVSKGLGLIPGNVIPVPNRDISGKKQKIPHIGWSPLKPSQIGDWEGTLMENSSPGEAAYFVHSFMAVTSDIDSRVADCIYGGHKVSAVISNGNISGCQFHPEKSGEVGLKILRQFCDN